jgi:hypothetical protein
VRNTNRSNITIKVMLNKFSGAFSLISAQRIWNVNVVERRKTPVN